MAEKVTTEMEKKELEQAELDRRDAEFQQQVEQLRRDTYPELYAVADRLAADQREREGAQAEENRHRIVGVVPGHDPGLQRRYAEDEKTAEAVTETAGDDNRIPSETTPQAATSQPNPPEITIEEAAAADAARAEAEKEDAKNARKSAAKK